MGADEEYAGGDGGCGSDGVCEVVRGGFGDVYIFMMYDDEIQTFIGLICLQFQVHQDSASLR